MLRPPSARFDDLSGASPVCVAGNRFVAEVVATSPEHVAPALAEVERQAASGRWLAGFVAYEAAPGLDPGLRVPGPRACGGAPLVWFGAFEEACMAPPVDDTAVSPAGPWTLSLLSTEHASALAVVRGHIAAGDTYQVNLTARLRAEGIDPESLYVQLLRAQRPAYGALIDTGRHVVASASPELFFEWSDGILRCRPMKGTASRGRWPSEDAAARAHLAESAKDRAENVMIVDLIRSDLGRVCEYGSVAVTSLFGIEAYPTVWQLTSEVVGRPRADVGLVDIVRALFPCGSVTGAPKQRTMELIADLESTPRGVYCGAVGWVGPGKDGSVRARWNVAIRTAVVDRASGTAEFGSGGGIVWDSDPDEEWCELEAKAAALTLPVTGFDLVETLLGGRHLDRHLRRVASSAERFGFAFDEAEARARMLSSGTGRVRLRLHRSGVLELTEGPAPPVDEQPVRVCIDSEPVCSGDPLLFHKTTRRAPYERRRARHPHADDVLLVNERDEVTESTIANLVYSVDGRWFTPPLASGCLPGIGREVMLEEGAMSERTLRLTELQHVDGLALVSSLRGWRPAVLLAGAASCCRTV